jgi:hypothetical protein
MPINVVNSSDDSFSMLTSIWRRRCFGAHRPYLPCPRQGDDGSTFASSFPSWPRIRKSRLVETDGKSKLMPLRIKRDWRHGPGIALCDHVGRRRRVFLEMLRVPMRLVRGLVVIDLVEEDVIPIACQNHDVELAAPRLFDGRRAVLLDAAMNVSMSAGIMSRSTALT